MHPAENLRSDKSLEVPSRGEKRLQSSPISEFWEKLALVAWQFQTTVFFVLRNIGAS